MEYGKTKVSVSLLSTMVLMSIACSLVGFTQEKDRKINSTKELVQFIKKNRYDGHLKSFTFIQETIRLNPQQQPVDTSTWFEAIRYPKEFRIDFGNPENGNANINRNDSIYVYRESKMVHSGPEIQEFLILEGGLFYYSVEETLKRLEGLGINTSLFTKSTYKGRPIYIIGAKDEKFDRPQIWMDAERFYVVRRLSKGKKGELYEARYDDFKHIGGHWIETWIEFLVDGKVIQTERYNDIDVSPNLDDRVFDPERFGSYYWFKN
jgi:hypothetical protein